MYINHKHITSNEKLSAFFTIDAIARTCRNANWDFFHTTGQTQISSITHDNAWPIWYEKKFVIMFTTSPPKPRRWSLKNDENNDHIKKCKKKSPLPLNLNNATCCNALKFLLRKNHNYWVWLMLVLPQTEKMAYTTWRTRRRRRVVDERVYLDQWVVWIEWCNRVITCYLFLCRWDEFTWVVYMGNCWVFDDGVKSVVCRGKIWEGFCFMGECVYILDFG